MAVLFLVSMIKKKWMEHDGTVLDWLVFSHPIAYRWVELIWYRWRRIPAMHHNLPELAAWEDVDVPLCHSCFWRIWSSLGYRKNPNESPSSSHFYGLNMLKHVESTQMKPRNSERFRTIQPVVPVWHQPVVVALDALPIWPQWTHQLVPGRPTARSTRSLEDCIGLYYSIFGWGLDSS